MSITFEGRTYALPKSDTKLGVENLKPVVRFAARVVSKIREFSADGKYSVMEMIRTPFVLAEGLEFFTPTRLERIARELVDLDEAEAAELIRAIGDELGMNFATAELYLTRVVRTIEAVRSLVQAIQD